jgi:hypothetical protein
MTTTRRSNVRSLASAIEPRRIACPLARVVGVGASETKRPTTYTPPVSPTRLLWAVAVALAVTVAVGMAYDRRSDSEPTVTVMVAKQLIPAGGYVMPDTFTFETIPRGEVEPGTVADARYLAYHTVAHQIFPGEMLSAAAFSPYTGLPCVEVCSRWVYPLVRQRESGGMRLPSS